MQSSHMHTLTTARPIAQTLACVLVCSLCAQRVVPTVQAADDPERGPDMRRNARARRTAPCSPAPTRPAPRRPRMTARRPAPPAQMARAAPVDATRPSTLEQHRQGGRRRPPPTRRPCPCRCHRSCSARRPAPCWGKTWRCAPSRRSSGTGPCPWGPCLRHRPCRPSWTGCPPSA